MIIGRPNADASSTLRERPYRSQESGERIDFLSAFSRRFSSVSVST
ncbi:hypothetical protein H5968_04200 [Sphaerospermopsis sp. LEGE 00249]|nr:hypothetical protein [Sphaerospermopsis sp. LEGE 00249]